jgi:hypothetical protein
MSEKDAVFYGGFMTIVLGVGVLNIMFGNGNGAIACAIVFAAAVWSSEK